MAASSLRVTPSSALLALVLVCACGEVESGGEDAVRGGAGSGAGPTAGGSANAGTGTGPAASGGTRPGTGGSSAGGNGAGAATGGSAGFGGVSAECEGSAILAEERISRLSFPQIAASLRALLGNAFADTVETKYEIGSRSPQRRTFPALVSPLEGSAVSDTLLPKYDGIALLAGDYVLAHFDEVTGCGDDPSEACALDFIASFAEQAFRRPVEPDELESLSVVYDELRELPGTITEATAATVSAMLSWPQFIYRTEFGDAVGAADPLTAYELASALAYALTDAPPDAVLLKAAAAGQLATDAEILVQAQRLLGAPATRRNLESALYSAFEFGKLDSAVRSDPAFTPALRAAASHELELFLEDTLWSGPLTELLTRRTSFVNPSLAAIYGLATPGPDADLDTFLPALLPEQRGGLLTLPGALSSFSLGSRTNVASVVERGSFVRTKLLCFDPFPTSVEVHQDLERVPSDTSQREWAEYRAATVPCSGCHNDIDAYGLALDTFDDIGRYRTTDAEGRAIDPGVTLPAVLGGATVKDAVEMQARIAESPLFTRCFARQMLTFTLEQPKIGRESCAVSEVTKGFEATDQSLAALIGRVATSKAFRVRLAR
jgi:hypothetical protein